MGRDNGPWETSKGRTATRGGERGVGRDDGPWDASNGRTATRGGERGVGSGTTALALRLRSASCRCNPCLFRERSLLRPVLHPVDTRRPALQLVDVQRVNCASRSTAGDRCNLWAYSGRCCRPVDIQRPLLRHVDVSKWLPQSLEVRRVSLRVDV